MRASALSRALFARGGISFLRSFLGEPVGQVGVHQAEDPRMLRGVSPCEAWAEAPFFHGHSRRQGGSTGVPGVETVIAAGYEGEGIQYGVADLVGNPGAIALTETHGLHWVLRGDSAHRLGLLFGLIVHGQSRERRGPCLLNCAQRRHKFSATVGCAGRCACVGLGVGSVTGARTRTLRLERARFHVQMSCSRLLRTATRCNENTYGYW